MNMTPNVSVSHPNDVVAKEITDALMLHVAEKYSGHLLITTRSDKNFGPEFYESFFVGIASGVAGTKLLDLAEFLLGKFKERRYHGTPLVFSYKNEIYILPRDTKKLQTKVAEDANHE